LIPACAGPVVKTPDGAGGLSVIGYQNLTRPKSYHLKKAT
jgi:hypothetical protein